MSKSLIVKYGLSSFKMYRPAMLRQWHGLSLLGLGERRVHTPDDIW